MGADGSKLSKEDCSQLKGSTHWTQTELRDLHKQFKKENPSGHVCAQS